MKRILVTGAGGSPAVNFTRSLRALQENFYLIGTDCNVFYLQRAETDETHLVPCANEDDYIGILNDVIDESNAELIHAQNDLEVYIISKNREKLNIKTFLPEQRTIDICLNKFESYKLWKKEGIKQPETLKIDKEKDLAAAFQILGNKIWLREVSGAGGKGSISVENYETAKSWIDFRNGWGKFTAAECLEPQSITWQSIWKDGELIVAQSRKRLYWELAKLAPSGISGVTGAGVTASDSLVDDIAQRSILAIDKNPNGIFSVDLTYDNKGLPNPTEINIGRFFTTHEFFTRAGLNMPYIFVKLACNEKIPNIERKINPLPTGLVWIRGVDFVPVFTDMTKIKYYEEILANRKKIATI